MRVSVIGFEPSHKYWREHTMDGLPVGIDPELALEDCSAIIVGKQASATGEVLFGHNEDDSGNNVMMQHLVPRATHERGSLLEFEPDAPRSQVEQTWAYLWSETRASWKSSFSDTFINEWGVASLQTTAPLPGRYA